MFKRVKLIIKNRKLQKENEKLYKENKLKLHAKLLAEDTIKKLFELEQIERSGISEETKRKQKNVIYNELRKRNINMIKELSSKFGNDR